MSDYEKGKQLIADSNFTIKKLKTFRGHDGDGVNADVYLGRTKIAEVDDDGWGGGLSIDYFENGEWTKAGGFKLPQVLTDFLDKLPSYTTREYYESGTCPFAPCDVIKAKFDEVEKWDAEAFFNELIETTLEKREFKRILRKVCAIKEVDGEEQLVSWKYKKSDLTKIFRTKEGVATLSEILSEDGTKIINLLPEEEAFALLRKHA